MPRRQRRKARKVSKNVKRYVRNAIGSSRETKAFSVTDIENSLVSTTAGTIIDLSEVASGSGGTAERDAQEIRAFGLHLNYILLSSGVSVTIPQYVRVCVISCESGDFVADTEKFLYKDNNPDLLTASTLTDIISPLNKREFQVLYDRTHKLEGQAEGMGASSVKVKKLLKFNHKRNFPSISTSESVNKNLRLLIFNREIDNDANAVTCEWSLFSNYYFKDM